MGYVNETLLKIIQKMTLPSNNHSLIPKSYTWTGKYTMFIKCLP